MPEPRCVVTAPLPLARGLGFSEAAMVVAADAIVRRAWALGRAAELLVPTLTGDLASQYGLERELARDGHDRSTLDAEQLDSRHAAYQEERRMVAAEVLTRLSVTADVGAATAYAPGLARAARTAFVKLFEEGLVEESDRVVNSCPRCRTAVDAYDAERGEIAGEMLTLGLVASTGDHLEVRVCEPELLQGVVAIAVPEGTAGAGGRVTIPITGREVPVLSTPDFSTPSLIVAAHDVAGHRFAVSSGLLPERVLDDDGVVRVEGPLGGLGRYAARAAARGLLESEGVIIAADRATEEVWRCGCCGTILVPQLRHHWCLRIGDLELLAADAVRNGLVTFSPPEARDAFLAAATVGRDWCLSTTVGGGVALPSASCIDCGKTTVDVDTSSSCGKCMGLLVAESLFLDARFVAAVWATTLGGWPGKGSGISATDETTALVTSAALEEWLLPAIALGLRLSGVSPFSAAVVHPWPATAFSRDSGFLDADPDPRVLRMALVAGTEDLETARAAVAALDRSAAPDIDPVEVAEAASAGVAALDDGSPAQAAGLLASALSGGVPAAAASRLRALALPILGD